jgi:hypothetical protein
VGSVLEVLGEAKEKQILRFAKDDKRWWGKGNKRWEWASDDKRGADG